MSADLTDAEVQAQLRAEFEAMLDEAEKLSEADNYIDAATSQSWYFPDNPSDPITDRIWCGGDDYLFDHNEHAKLVRVGITHVLDCRSEHASKFLMRHASMAVQRQRKNAFTYLVNPTDDDFQPKSAAYFKRSIDFGLRALQDPKAKLYVHCAAGINRGPSSAYAILRALGHAPTEAENLLRSGRPGVGIAYARDADRAIKELGYGR